MGLCLEATLKGNVLTATLRPSKEPIEAVMAKEGDMKGSLTYVPANERVTPNLHGAEMKNGIAFVTGKVTHTKLAAKLKMYVEPEPPQPEPTHNLSATLSHNTFMGASLRSGRRIFGTLKGEAAKVKLTATFPNADFVYVCPIDGILSAFSLGAWHNDLPWDNDLGWTN